MICRNIVNEILELPNKVEVFKLIRGEEKFGSIGGARALYGIAVYLNKEQFIIHSYNSILDDTMIAAKKIAGINISHINYYKHSKLPIKAIKMWSSLDEL